VIHLTGDLQSPNSKRYSAAVQCHQHLRGWHYDPAKFSIPPPVGQTQPAPSALTFSVSMA
jgi:hypothetical protein